MVQASIITIGDELLIGQVVDTNSTWMAQQLNNFGIELCRRVAVGDTRSAIIQAIEQEQKIADIILLTGGLGPTSDDITKPLLCDYFGGELVLDQQVLDNITILFKTYYNREVTERNRQQAFVPDVCTVLPNAIGTAPGMLFTKGKKVFISMPGVPAEMHRMMSDHVLPYLVKQYNVSALYNTTSVMFGIGESNIADMLIDFEKELPAHVKLAYLPNHGIVRLRLSGSGSDVETIQKTINAEKEKLQLILSEYLIAEDDLTMQQILANLLLQRNERMCTAESCTGGYIAHLLTLLPGSSAWYDGSVVSYSYAAKENMLGVANDTLVKYGAVSEEVVKEMAKGALEKMKTTYSVAVSGIMGPAGGMEEKPVGTVWVCVGDAEMLVAKKFHFRYNRAKNIELTALNALNMLRAFIQEKTNPAA